MKAKEKAKELVDKFNDMDICFVYDGGTTKSKNEADKQCALICVEEINKSIIWSSDFNGEKKIYWNQVKKEIENL